MASFHTFLILAYIISPILCKCLKTTCDCVEDHHPTIYQCPNGGNIKVFIQVGENNAAKVVCHEMQSPDHLLPRKVFSPTHLTLENCIISNRTANLLNFTNVEVLNLDESILQEDFIHILFGTNLPRLRRITFSAMQINYYPFLEDVNAPNLNFVEFHKMKKKMISLDGNIFENFSNLLQLHLTYNSIEELNNEAFKGLKNLEILNLGFNKIKFISRQVLRPLQSLIRADLQSNYGIVLDDFQFANFSELSIVYLGGSGLTFLPETIFSGSINLSEIYLNDNNIFDIPRKLFEGLVNLKYIDLNNNQIKALSSGTFRSLFNLRILELNNNKISSIGRNYFSGLSKLMDLRLKYNNITTIDDKAFRTNVHLEKLDLSNNRYEYEVKPGKLYTRSPFSMSKNLKHLDLSYNLMKDVPDDLFIHARLLEYLNLEGNKIEILDLEEIQQWREAFKNIKINLRNNNISHFDQSRPRMVDPDYEGIVSEVDIKDLGQQLQHSILLNISHNPLICDCYAENFADFIKKNPGIFFDINELKCVNPSHMRGMALLDVPASQLTCDLQYVSDAGPCVTHGDCSCLWRPFDKAIVVNCSSTKMTTIPVLNTPLDLIYEKIELHFEDNMLTEFSRVEGYENVTSLFLARNNINRVSWIPSNIEIIDISYNNLTELNESILNVLNLQSVKNISMGNNLWLCDCDNYHMKSFMVENIRKIDAENIECASSKTKMHYLLMEDFCSENYLIIIKVTLSLFPIIIIFALLCFKYELEIKVWLYSRNLCIGFLVEEDLDRHKDWDVFICYSHKDAEFVEEVLVPEMKGYKLCLHHRDWTVGNYINENIAISVAKSKRTLIVLTPNFIESQWCLEEFRISHAEAMKERRNRVILLLKEDIDTEKMNEELKSYVSTKTYIKWNDPWFWKKLRYALPHSVSLNIENN